MLGVNMKKLMSVPVFVIIAALAVACGKSKEDSTVVVAGAVPAPSVLPPVATPLPPVISPPPSGVNMAAWCYQKGGIYESGSNTCRLSETTRFGWNRYYGTIDTGILVYPGDAVTVRVDGAHQITVGGASYAGSFISHTHGSLVVKGNGFNSFKILSVSVTRCYNSLFYAVACQ
jgi:hypothetical protein